MEDIMKGHRIFQIFCTVLLLVILFQGAPLSQEITQSYQERELQASQEIKSKLKTLREQIRSKEYTFQVGYTKAMDYTIEQITGLVVPPNLSELIGRQTLVAERLLDQKLVSDIVETCSANASSFDWRKNKGATPVRDQNGCGSCWAFATHGAFEGSYRIKNNLAIDSSEQDTLDCNTWSYNCNGGWWAHQYLIDTGSAKESAYPYTATQGTCNSSVARPYKALTWGYVGSVALPNVTELKQALCKYGPLAVAVQVTPMFQAYTGGVFNACENVWQGSTSYSVGDLIMPSSGDVIYICIVAGASGSTEPSWPSPQPGNPHPTVNDGTVVWQHSGTINHGVTLIGWDDKKGAWLIKNSWGTSWGETGGYSTEKGYMWISYGCSNIGYGASWIQAKKKNGCW